MKLGSRVLEVLQEIGIRSGQTVLDFGSYLDMSIIPAARVVGRGRRVYALDNDKEALDELGKELSQPL